MRISLLFLGLLAAGAPRAVAQEPAPPADGLVDRVLAVAGDSAILKSDVDLELLRLAQAGQPLPTDPVALDALRRQILEAQISELLLVQAAERDSLTVPEDEVTARVDRDVARLERQLGGPAGLEQALRAENLTIAQYREILAAGYRRTMLAQQYIQQIARERQPPPVTEEEIRAYFEARKDQLGERPATVAFRQVVVAPRPSDEARAAARAEAEEVLAKARAGEDFETLARRYSDDPGSRDNGGDLGWFRTGVMVPEFDRAAFSLRPGEISGVVESAFGFHVIKLEKIRGAERQARHVLIRPELTDADIARARETAERVAGELRAGASIDELVERHGDPSEQSEVSAWPLDRLPPPYDTALAGVRAGEVVGPLELGGEGGASKWAVVKVTEFKEAGEHTLDDPEVHARIREQLQQQKLIEEVVQELRRRSYVDVRL